jgi:hypothetical protein
MESVSSTDWEKVFARLEEQFTMYQEQSERLIKLVGEIADIAIAAPSNPEMEAIQKLIVDRLGGVIPES